MRNAVFLFCFHLKSRFCLSFERQQNDKSDKRTEGTKSEHVKHLSVLYLL